MSKNILVKIYKNNFASPVSINWGHSLFLCAVGTLIVYLLQFIAIKLDFLYNSTSVAGYFITSTLLVTFALLLPVATLYIEKKTHPRNVMIDSIGNFSGIGILLLAFLSGISISFIKIPLHNLCTWLWLRMGNTIIFPAFFFVNDGATPLEKSLAYISDVALPAFGIAMFFTGLLWACITENNRKYAYVIIPLSLAIFSLNPTDFVSYFAIGLWLCFLREKSGNVFAPLFALLSSGIVDMFITKYVNSVDITMVQVYSDMDSTYLFSSGPAFIAGIILLAFFAKPINEFSATYNKKFGFENDETPVRSISSGINLALIVAAIIFIILWIMVFRGE